MARVRIGQMLMQRGRIDELQLQSALAHQERWGGPLGRAVVSLGFVEEPTVLALIGEQLGTPCVLLANRPVPRDVLALLPERFMRTRKVLPLARPAASNRGQLVVAFANPGDLALRDEVAFLTGLEVQAMLAGEDDLDRALTRLLGAPTAHAIN